MPAATTMRELSELLLLAGPLFLLNSTAGEKINIEHIVLSLREPVYIRDTYFPINMGGVHINQSYYNMTLTTGRCSVWTILEQVAKN
jgi:hypothetical protein